MTNKPLQNILVARVSTVHFYVLTQLAEQIQAIKNAGASISVVASGEEMNLRLDLPEDYEFISIYIPREISLFKDTIALYKLWQLFRTHHFDIVHSTTPKAGLLCAIAARLAFIPIRLHTFTGQTWATLGGMKRKIVKFCDKIIGIFNTRCYADSPSQKDYLIKENVIKKEKLLVLGNGSLAGVNLQRFSSARFSKQEKANIKLSLGIEKDPLILLFVGRINKDKGVFELIEAFEQLIKLNFNLILLVVGPFEQNMEPKFQEIVKSKCLNKVIFTGFSAEPERYMAIADILCIPSYREGFGTVVIEAAAMGLPAVGTKIYGLTDAIVDGETGILVEPRSSLELAKALEKLVINEDIRIQMGKNALNRVIRDFDSINCNELLIQEYKELFDSTLK
jgi:glycosyltransferase involved in cell wall biosynthesis